MRSTLGTLGLILVGVLPAHAAPSGEVLIDMHLQVLSCAATAFFAGDHSKEDALLDLGATNVELILERAGPESDPGGIVASWIEFNAYRYQTRDYILGYDYANAVTDVRNELVGIGSTDAEKVAAAARGLFVGRSCTKFDGLL